MLYEEARNNSVAVEASVVQICPARVRQEIVLTNTGATNITLSFGSATTAGAGVFLVPYACYFANNSQGFNVWTGEIYAIGSGAGGTLAVFER